MANVRPLSPRATIKLAMNPQNISFLAAYYAMDKGYFDQAGLDINYIEFRGSSNTQLPLLARGDIDMSTTTPSPPLFNQLTSGFDIKAIAPFDVPHQGRLSSAWINVIKDEAGQIKELSDLKGKKIDATVEGSPNALLVLEALRLAGLKPGADVTLQYNGRTPGDMLALAQNKAVDALTMTEPQSTQAEQQGLTVKWKSFQDITSWYQPAYLAVSSNYVQNNRAAVEKFLEVYLIACREIDASNGQWTPEVLNFAAKRAEVDPAVITSQGGTPYFDPNGAMNVDSLSRVQEIWLTDGQIQQKVDVAQLVDQSVLDDALKAIGKV